MGPEQSRARKGAVHSGGGRVSDSGRAGWTPLDRTLAGAALFRASRAIMTAVFESSPITLLITHATNSKIYRRL